MKGNREVLNDLPYLPKFFINKMINIQKLRQKSQIKDGNTWIPSRFRITQLASTSTDKFINLNGKYSKGSPAILKRHYSCEKKVCDRPRSKTVTLFFNQNTVFQKKESSEILKIVEDSCFDKIYKSKKKNYSKFLKQTRTKAKNQSINKLITIQSRPLSLINFNQTLFYRDANLITRKRKSKTQNKLIFQNQKTQESYPQQVAIFQPKQLSKVQKKAFQMFLALSQSEIRQETIKGQQIKDSMSTQKKNSLLVRTLSQQTQPDGKNRQCQCFIPFKRMKETRKPFTFALFQKQTKINLSNQMKLLSYKDFLWKINYSNGLYVRPAQDQHNNFRVYVGFGNNDSLIKAAMKRRFWWSFTENIEECNFAWTQLKLANLFTKQNECTGNNFRPNLIAEAGSESQLINLREKSKNHYKVFNVIDLMNWVIHEQRNKRSERIISQKTYKNRIKFISCKQLKTIEKASSLLVHNHLSNNGYIGNKKALFYNLKKYYQMQKKDVFSIIPITFHLSRGIQDQQWASFKQLFNHYQKQKKKGVFQNVWILKPGQNSNRGNGITVCYDFEDIRLRLKEKQRNRDGTLRTFIIQKYIEKPLLYHDRKFDIRHYMLISCLNGNFKAYWYNEGYIRTSSSLYTLKRGSNIFIHLTNDAIQKNSQEYSKYEPGNKISYEKFNTYVKSLRNSNQPYFYDNILPQMKQMAVEAVKSCFLSLDTGRKAHNFQLFGMDFMIDADFRPWLIEINTNPCLQLSSGLLTKIIPNLIEQTLQICVDPLFPGPNQWPSNRPIENHENSLPSLNFQLIFDEETQGEQVKKLLGSQIDKTNAKIGKLEEDSQTFQSQGSPFQI